MPNQTISVPVGKIIAKHRKEKGLTQEAVAEYLNITIEAVSRMERGTIMPSLKRLQQFADIFECTPADLLTQSSHHLNDQYSYIINLLEGLTEQDRVFIIESIEKTTAYLREKNQLELKKCK